MPRELICLDCGETFIENSIVYGGSNWCESCRSKHQDAAIQAKNAALEQFKRICTNPYEVERRADEVLSEVLNNRIRSSKYYNGG